MLRVIPPTATTSPAAPLVQHVPHALANVAPEHTQELNKILDGYTLEIVEDTRWICNADVPKKHISISTRVLEILWAQAFAVHVFYQRTVAGTLPDGSVLRIADPVVLEALRLYRWALTRFMDDTPSEWPASLPRPTEEPLFASDLHVAQELALVGVGHLLLHEVAHIDLRHTTDGDAPWSLDQERDADAWVADWVLSRGAPTAPEMIKRSIGVALALLTLVSRGIYMGKFNGVTHPRDFDRLYNALAHRVPAANDEAWAVIVVVLSLHCTNANVPIPEGPFEDHAEAANAFLDLLADYAEGRRPLSDF
jgi:hypothetical protein